MQTLECTGLWWLPQDEASYVGGTLRISANGDLTLSLVGALGPVEHPFGNKNHNVILGSVDKSPGGNEVSLVGCMRTQGTFGSFAGLAKFTTPAAGTSARTCRKNPTSHSRNSG